MRDGVGQSGTEGSLAAMGLDGFAPYLMNRIMGRYNAGLRAKMAQMGLTMPKMRALAVLSVMEGPLTSELAVHAVVEQSTLSRALDQLVADGLVRRVGKQGDNRAAHLFLTPAGAAAFAELWPYMAASCGQMFDGIDRETQAGFVQTLQRMLANIRKHDL